MKLDAKKFACATQEKGFGGSLHPPELCEEIAKILYFELALFSGGHNHLRKCLPTNFSLAVSE